jgi:pimeloyl-ACP methyl ester carboxylesterase
MIAPGGYGFGDRAAAALLGSAASGETLALVEHTLRATNPAGFMQAVRFGALGEMPPLSSGLPENLLLIRGKEDRVTPEAMNAALLLAVMPGAEIVRLAGCGHLPEVEAPQRCNELITQHFGRRPIR